MSLCGVAPPGPAFIQSLKDSDEYVSLNAAQALGRIGDIKAIPGLVNALGEISYANMTMRSKAARALGDIGVAAVDALIEDLQDLDRDVRRNAALALGEIGEAAGIPTLLDAITDDDETVRRLSAVALGKLGHVAAVPVLVESLEAEPGLVRDNASDALVSIGIGAIWALIDRHNDQKTGWFGQSVVLRTLDDIGDAVNLPRLVVAGRRFPPSHRITILEAMGRFRPHRTAPLKYRVMPVSQYCKSLLNGDSVIDEFTDDVKQGARDILGFLSRSVLLRPGERNPGVPSAELVRPATADEGGFDPDTLVRAPNPPAERATDQIGDQSRKVAVWSRVMRW